MFDNMPMAGDEHFVHHQSMNVEDDPDATGNAKEIMRGRAEGVNSSRPQPSATRSCSPPVIRFRDGKNPAVPMRSRQDHPLD